MGLDTTARFPRYARSAQPDALANEESMRRIDDQAHLLTGFTEVTIPDGNGNYWTVLAKPGVTGASAFTAPWGLEIVDAAAGQVRIKVGTIIADMSDLFTGVTITNPTEVFTPSAGDKIWIEITEYFPAEATLVMGAEWGADGAYVLTGTGASVAMTSYHHPVWDFAATGTPEDGYRQINEDLWGVQCEDSHLRLISANYHRDADTRPLVLPLLIHCHRLLN